MAKIDDIYGAVDDYGLVTSAEARELGVGNQELVQMAHRGKLVRVARGVYRMPVWPYQEQAPYAVAVKAAGEGAYLFGESVVALLGLAPTDPRRMWVATPGRVRRQIGGTTLVARGDADTVVPYEGIFCQDAAAAIVSAAATMGPARALEAARNAARQGYITEEQEDEIGRELAADAQKTE